MAEIERLQQRVEELEIAHAVLQQSLTDTEASRDARHRERDLFRELARNRLRQREEARDAARYYFDNCDRFGDHTSPVVKREVARHPWLNMDQYNETVAGELEAQQDAL